MCLNLYTYLFKASKYSYASTSLKSMATTNQKHTIDPERPKEKELKHTTKENHQTIKGETKSRNKQKRTTETTGR